MNLTSFSFELPESLIAHYPKIQRSSCRLLSLDGLTGTVSHGIFTDLIDKLNPGDLLVFNDTRVIPARLYGRKTSGGKIEVLVERMLDNKSVLAYIRTSKLLEPGTELLFGRDNNINATIVRKYHTFFEIKFNDKRSIINILNSIGHIPIPPYIGRAAEEIDYQFYQTIYNQKPGSIAAPTAGLHFDKEMLVSLRTKGIKIAFITLHIGSGTFYPVRVFNIKDHIMHTEYTEVSKEVVNEVLETKRKGNRVIAVGTTSVRSLESAAQAAKIDLIEPFFGETKIFIYPSYQYKIIDALITNFHFPKSTLIMLVSAFAGHLHTMNAYKSAIKQKYRFFSYGDAMYITYNPKVLNEHIEE